MPSPALAYCNEFMVIGIFTYDPVTYVADVQAQIRNDISKVVKDASMDYFED